ncbi:class I SAM-dependent methyltransferase [Candidatus Nitrospira inopinata]|jgi:ubiquinone/menaquinone biosynthesis C-methylase UbiE|nr:class I SAM-dependent methyltransferase [Candidatus Nitrospira inopinata]
MKRSEIIQAEKMSADAHSGGAIHQKWVANYRTPEMQAFYDMAFDKIVKLLDAPRDSMILDAGCGSCAKSVLLASKGFRVTAVDYSADALKLAKETIYAQGLADRVTLKQEDLLGLSFPDRSFQYALCWGVLMHIPDVQRALSELARIVKPGGILVLSEGNVNSMQAKLMRTLKKLLRRERAEVRHIPAGIEYLEKTDQGTLLTRQTNMSWLITECDRLGFDVKARIAGQFTELYVAVPWRPFKTLLHGLNSLWFQHVGWAGPAFGNILILEKRLSA